MTVKRKILAVCSLKGGTGCSLVSAGLAAAFARKGRKTLVIDLDPVRHSLDFFFGIQDRLLFDLTSFAEGKIDGEKLLLQDEYLPQLWHCPSPDGESFFEGEEGFRKLFLLLDTEDFERVIFDLPGGNQALQQKVLPWVEECIAVTVQNPASVLAAELLAAEYAELKKHLVINRFDLSDVASYRKGRSRAIEMIDAAHIPLLGIIPESYSLLRRSEEGLLTSLPEKEEDAPFDNMAARLEGGEVPLFSGTGFEKIRTRL